MSLSEKEKQKIFDDWDGEGECPICNREHARFKVEFFPGAWLPAAKDAKNAKKWHDFPK